MHIHGTGIDATGQGARHVTALTANSGGAIHANASAFVLQTGVGGHITRISNSGGHVHAPYLWEHAPDTDGDPATINTNFTSADGADQFVSTTGSDGYPHPKVFSSKCATDTSNTKKWFDTVDRVCVNQ